MVNKRRANGTGQIKQVASGRWEAKAVGGANLGRFDTEAEAQRAIDDSIASSAPRVRGTTLNGAAKIGKGIGRYLDALADGTNGNTSVNLGALAGFPARTDDPEVLARAIKAIEAQAGEGSAVYRLKRQQRLITLRRELEWLRDPRPVEDEPEAFFIEHAKQWATEAGIGYSAFRVMGVPAAVLTRAGITRGFEP